MKSRCPNAQKGEKYTLKGYRLTFRCSLPDILPDENGEVVGGLWEITESDEAKLDIYEGYHGPGFPNNLYNKHFTQNGIMFYRMALSLDDQPEDNTIRDVLMRYFGSRSEDDPPHGILGNMMNGLIDFGITEEELRISLGSPIDSESGS